MSNELKLVDNEKQVSYTPASDNCQVLNTVVPKSMAIEQQKFNERLRIEVGDVDEYVARKLHYKNKESLCLDKDDREPNVKNGTTGKFSAEQIDAIATAIWNHESNGDAIIIADQTGIGKGRVAAGLLRYGYFNKDQGMPIFLTEKSHLINDIYRDLRDIGFDCGVSVGKYETVKKEITYTTSQIQKQLIKDLSDTDDLRVDYVFPDDDEFDVKFVKYFLQGKKLTSKDEAISSRFDIEGISEELMALYEEEIALNGISKPKLIMKTPEQYKRECDAEIAKGKVLFRPFVFKADLSIFDSNGNVYYDKIPAKERDLINRKGDFKKFETINFSDIVLPDKFKCIALPYSMVQTGIKDELPDGSSVDTVKGIILKKYATDCCLVMDEAHNAAGISKTGVISATGQFIRLLMNYSSMVTFISATFSKTALNMPLYASKTSIRESNLGDEELINVFIEGGNSLQESVAAELVRNGQLLRREKLIEGKKPIYLEESSTSQNGLNQIGKLNRVAPIFLKIMEFSQDVAKEFKEVIEYQGQDETTEYKFAGKVGRQSFNLFNFFILSIKVNQAVEQALNNLRNGRKTVITVASTMESALNNFKKDYLDFTKSNATDNAKGYNVGDKIKNDFSLYMLNLVRGCLSITKSETTIELDGSTTVLASKIDIATSNDPIAEELFDRIKEEYVSLVNEIKDINFAISISPIDSIKDGIERAAEGFKVDEITGRTKCVKFSSEDQEFGTVEMRKKIPTTELVNKFNNNEVDCLIINQSGATGISLHAKGTERVTEVYDVAPTSLINKNEIKARAMIITQMELDINKEVQKLGRINRTGQVYQPEFTYLVSAIPSEARLSAMMEKKLRSLSANVNADQNQSSHLFESEDFFSDEAVIPCNFAIDSDIELSRKYGIKRVKNKADIYNLTKLLYFIDYNAQYNFYTTFATQLDLSISKAIADGSYKGKMGFKDFKSISLGKFPFYLGDVNAKTSFGGHSVLELCEVTEYKNLNYEYKIKAVIESKLSFSAFGESGLYKDFEFRDISNYVSELKKEIEKESLRDQKERDEKISDIRTSTAGLNTEIKQLQSELVQYEKLQIAEKLEDEVVVKQNELKRIEKKYAEAESDGDTELLAPLNNKIETIKKELDPMRLQLVEYAELLTKKDELKTIERNIKIKLSAIENNESKIESEISGRLNIDENILRISKYLSFLGHVVEERCFEYQYVWNDEIQKSEYVPVQNSAQFAVLTNFKAPSMINGVLNRMSQWEVGYTRMDDNFTIPLSQLDQDRSIVKIETRRYSYDGNWNRILSKMRTSSQNQRFIAYGSMLSTFKLTKNNGLEGAVIKYTTNENAIRIGIEIIDAPYNGRDDRTIYDEIKSRYTGNLAYPIFFASNSHNVERYVKNYVERIFSTDNRRDVYFEILLSIGKAIIHFNRGAESVKIYASAPPKRTLITDVLYKFLKNTAADQWRLRYDNGVNTTHYLNAEPYKTFFPTSFSSNYTGYDGFKYSGELTVGVADFYDLLDKLYTKQLTTNAISLTLATSSKYFDEFKNDYVFEQFKDDVVRVVETPSGVDFEEVVDNSNKLESIINELVKILQ